MASFAHESIIITDSDWYLGIHKFNLVKPVHNLIQKILERCYPLRILECRRCSYYMLDTGVGCQSLLQGIFPTQVSKLGLLYCRQILHHYATWEAL